MTMNEIFIGMFFTANILFCLAYVVRDMLYLRAITIVAAFMTFPYFYFQDTPLWSPLFWQSMFILINGFNLIVLLLRMRPVALGPLEERLHLMVFNIMTPRELLELIEIGSWRSKPAGDNIISQGERVDGVCLLAEGDTAVIVDGDQKAQLGEGDFFGEMSFITGGAATADVCATSEVTYLYWERSKLNAFYDKHPRIKDVMQAVLGRNMAEKLKRTHQK